MNIAEFIQKTVKTNVDYDKVFGCQCVDLFRQYCQDVLKIEHTGGVDGAKDIYLNYDKMPLEKKYFKKISGSTNIKLGDVAIWNGNENNKFGHIAIVMAKDGNNLLVLEQNGILQDGVKISLRSTERLLGYLRAK